MNFLNEYFKYDIGIELSGLTNQLNVFYVNKLREVYNRNIIVLTSSLYEANKIYNSLSKINDNLMGYTPTTMILSIISSHCCDKPVVTKAS